MEIYGLMRLTLLDYPEKAACTIFTGGCDFRCPFCHNKSVILKDTKQIPAEEIFDFLSKRRGILDGVCISGGEPLIQAGIIDFMSRVKALGYSVKLDTNGGHPKRLREALESGFCDYVAMDIKNSPEKYPQTVGIDGFDAGKISESIEIIKGCGIEHEFRTTAVRELHTEEDMRKLTAQIAGEEKYFIQSYTESENVLKKGLTAFDGEGLRRLLDAARENVPKAQLRGV